MSTHFIERLAVDKSNLKIIHENHPQASGLSTLKKSFLGQLFNNVKANWLMLAFVAPLVVWMVVSRASQMAADTSIGYSGNLWLGYPVVNDAAIVGAIKDMELAMQRALIMMPLIVIATVGLAGVFNIIKYLYWGFQIKVIKTFFRGVKNSFAPFLWVGLMLAVCFLLFTFVLNVFNVYTDIHLVWQILSYIGVGMLCLFVFLLSLFVTTQATAFNLTLMEILKNSMILGFKFILQNILIAAIGLVSMALPFLTFNNIAQMVAYILFFMLGFAWLAMVWTIYSHHLFDLIYIQKFEKKETAVAHASGQQGQQPQQSQQPKKQSQPKKTYQNPKKKKKQ